MAEFYAHSANRGGRWEPLREHLDFVARRARLFAGLFGAGDQAYLAGLLHDLGKYSEPFQERLRGAAVSLDHWTIGAVACAQWSQTFGLGPALAAQGHHVGLTALAASTKKFAEDVGATMVRDRDRHAILDFALARKRLEEDGFTLDKLTAGLALTGNADLAAGEMLDVRMLFSALVDADFLETEAHFQGDATSPRMPRPDGPTLDVERALSAVVARLEHVRGGAVAPGLKALRERLLANCIAAGKDTATGAFTLAAPTGAGKTLAMLAFALEHARKHKLRRIVLAMPFLNIVDQTAAQYETMFGVDAGFDENFVLEQHSLVEDLGDAAADDSTRARDRRRRQLSQNWDAPIVLTTTVQLLESLHANKPGRCRKLHRLAKSVILLDEVQTLPPKLASLTLATLARLADPDGPYGSSVVFATATQPAFECLANRVRSYYRVGWNPREIASDPQASFAQAAGRTRIEWRDDRPIHLPALARELAKSPRVLAIVNLKRHATTLANELKELAPEGLFHLSTNMCPAHREKTLAEIRDRLTHETNPPTRVVATQCVEAGVDLDFRPHPSAPDKPVLYRALAPLDSIAQAAGRANRNGLSDRATVVVFRVEDDGKSSYPPGYGEGIAATELLLAGLRHDGIDTGTLDLIHDPRWIRQYYGNLYGVTGRPDHSPPDENRIHGAIEQASFIEVAKHYRLIEDTAINVVVPYDAKVFDELRREVDGIQPDEFGKLRAWQRKAKKHAVAIRNVSALRGFAEPVRFGEASPDSNASWFWLLDYKAYDPVLGLVPPSDSFFIV